MTFYIYILKHPETSEIIYVGCTVNWELRINTHRYKYRAKYGYVPIIEILEEFLDESSAKKRERELISFYRNSNPELHNSKIYKPGKLCGAVDKQKRNQGRSTYFRQKMKRQYEEMMNTIQTNQEYKNLIQ